MVIGGRRRSLFVAQVKGSFATTVREVDDETFRILENFNFEKLHEALVSAQKTVFHTGRERDGVLRLNVHGRVNEIRNNGEAASVSIGERRDVIQAWFYIKQMHFLIVPLSLIHI